MGTHVVNGSHINAVGIWFHALDTRRNLFLMRDDRKYKGHWGLPGGKIEEGESLYDTIDRECREEIGWMPEHVKLIPIEKFTADGNRFSYHTFFCLIEKEFIPELNHEHVGYAWIDNDIIPRPLHPGFWSTLKAEDVLSKVEKLISIYTSQCDI
jgi:ADP-ribose pyrophosphatase YjhB (NUDIX family)